MSLQEAIERAKVHQQTGAVATPEIPTTPNQATSLATAPVQEKPVCLQVVKVSVVARWELPWACFYGAEFLPSVDSPDGTGKTERLHMVFVRHEVIVHGKNLFGLRKAINAMTLTEIRETPGEYRAAANTENRPVIENIEVKLTGR